jgi:hypothetical protein
MIVLTAQISNANRLSSASKLMLAKPPRLRQAVKFPNKYLSAIGTNGAPCPFSATSFVLKSQTVVMPVSAAMVAPQPICVV